jgi:hypothetical protein
MVFVNCPIKIGNLHTIAKIFKLDEQKIEHKKTLIDDWKQISIVKVKKARTTTLPPHQYCQHSHTK